MSKRLEYPIVVERLPIEDGGGFVATVPDLPGCMSDGETPEEAVSNVQDAIVAWIEAARDLGHSKALTASRFRRIAYALRSIRATGRRGACNYSSPRRSA